MDSGVVKRRKVVSSMIVNVAVLFVLRLTGG
jgi:hypothetical protein